ncbi:PE family protein [Mycobacterium tuberculosis]|nr:PE family protein [Mycobacterium tuberculosis]CKP90981.1 PE family protein [Mycobacterium tuberculosis]CNM72992.1 PE family protein [Mycobacterium tuberculosis]
MWRVRDYWDERLPTAAAARPTTSVLAAGADEVSADVVALFGWVAR